MKKLPASAVLGAIFCNILFGSAFPMIKLGYESFGTTDDVFAKLLFAGIRFFLSGVAVLVLDIILSRGVPKVPKDNRKNLLLLGLTYTFLQYIFFYIGLSHTTGASGSVINSSSVFIAVILAHFLYADDKLTASKLIGSILGFVGVVIACFSSTDRMGISFFGEGFVLIASAFFVIGSVINKRASQKNSSFTVSAYNLLIGGFLLTAVGLIGYRGTLQITLPGILVLLYLIAVSSVGFTVWSLLLKKYPLGKLSVFNFVIPVSGTILSGIFLSESILTWQYGVAIVLVSIGIITVNRAKVRQQADN